MHSVVFSPCVYDGSVDPRCALDQAASIQAVCRSISPIAPVPIRRLPRLAAFFPHRLRLRSFLASRPRRGVVSRQRWAGDGMVVRDVVVRDGGAWCAETTRVMVVRGAHC